MEDNFPRGEENGKHFYIKDEIEKGLEEVIELENIVEIGQFLRLPQRMVQALKVGHEPLVDY